MKLMVRSSLSAFQGPDKYLEMGRRGYMIRTFLLLTACKMNSSASPRVYGFYL